MLEGNCIKCGYHCFGWALINQRNQSCPKCGSGLQIKDGNRVITGYSPFTAEEYRIKSPDETNTIPERKESN